VATVAAPPVEEALVRRVEELTARVEQLPDPDVRALADDLAAAVVQLYGEGLQRIFAALDPDVRARLAQDGVVASLMLIHGLYPVDLETRVREALQTVRPYMESHGGDVELLGIVDGVAQLRLEGSCSGCGASQSTMELAIERALQEAAPDLLGIDVEGVVAAAPRRPEPADDVEWVELPGVAGLERGRLVGAGGGLVVDGNAARPSGGLVIANVAGTLLAYHDACAGCGAPLTGGTLLGGLLTCSACELRFDLPRAGRCLDDDGLQLRPVPLLRNGGPVRVARPR
jgi:Fe-S cluster biogenesis protein NfuA/nitrite reductase/ring-hydroxylating ferredoxin subunit